MNTQVCCTLAFCWKTWFLGKMELLSLQNTQGCQLGTIQILIPHGLVVSNQVWAKNSTSVAGLNNTINASYWLCFVNIIHYLKCLYVAPYGPILKIHLFSVMVLTFGLTCMQWSARCQNFINIMLHCFLENYVWCMYESYPWSYMRHIMQSNYYCNWRNQY